MNNKLEIIAKHYGLKNQLEKTIEEMNELEVEINLARYTDKENKTNLAEEIADVYNMLDQLVFLLDIRSAVIAQKNYKIDRTLRRIAEEKRVYFKELNGHEKGQL